MAYKTKVALLIAGLSAIVGYTAFKLEVNNLEHIGTKYLKEECGTLQSLAVMGFNVEYRIRNEIRQIDNSNMNWIKKQAAKQAVRNVYDDCLYK